MKWFYAVDRQRQGPVSEEEFARLVREGKIGPDTLVWCQGLDNWTRYDALPAHLTVAAASAASAVGSPAGAESNEPAFAASSGTGTPAGENGAGAACGASAEAKGLDAWDTAVCAVSGRRLPKSQMFQYGGDWIAIDQRERFFQRLRGDVPGAGELEYAGFGIRVLAKLIDMIVLWVIGTIKDGLIAFALFGTFNFFHLAPGAQAANLMLFYALSIGTGILVGVAYSWFFLSRYQATPGKLALDLKVVRSDGTPLSGGRIVGRYFGEMLSSFILCIGYLMVAFDREEHKALHDMICDTRVVKNRQN